MDSGQLIQFSSTVLGIIVVINQIIGKILYRNGTFQERTIATQLAENQSMSKEAFKEQSRMLKDVLKTIQKNKKSR